MKNRILYTLLLSFIFNCTFAQDARFSQYHSNGLYLNPAFAGAFENITVTASYRDQWPTLDGSFKSTLIEYHQYVDKLHGGVGGYALYDRAGQGTISTELAKLIYSYHLQIDDKVVIQPAIGVGYTNKQINFDDLTFNDMVDPRYGFIYQAPEVKPATNKGFFDCNAGVLIYSKEFYGGFTVDHLTEPDEAFYSNPSPLPRKYMVHAGANIPLTNSDDAVYLSPDLIYLSQQDFNMWLAEVTVKAKWFLAGIGYRVGDAVIYYAGYQNNFLRIGYSHDKTISKLAAINAYSHEIFLAYYLKPKKQSVGKISLQPVVF